MATTSAMPSSLMSALSFISHESEPLPKADKQKHLASPAPTGTTPTQSVATSGPHIEPASPVTLPVEAMAPFGITATSQEVATSPVPTPPKLRIALIMTSLCACIFVAAIDVTIVSTAVPSIASHFHSSSGYQWVASAYVLGSTASTPSWGSISDIWGRKPILLTALVLFFIGSVICAVGESMVSFLAGRVVQGVGASGLLTLVNIAISDLFSLRDRSFYYGLTSVVWAVASGVGPILGGVFAQKLTFRWCFWINLPISGIVFVFLVFTMPHDNPKITILDGLKAIDWSGSLLIIGGTLMLLLGLNFGGVTFSWSSATVINLLVFSIFAIFLFAINEWKWVKYPVIPPRIFRKPSSFASFAVCFLQSFIMMGVAYYLPLYFQAVLGSGPLRSGICLLPFILSNTFSAAATGVYIQLTGKYISAVYLGLVLMVLGTGLLINLGVETNWSKIIIYQILVGAGVGMNFEGPQLALQASVDVKDVATATATMGFTRQLSTAISAIIGGVVFQNQMLKESSVLSRLGADVAALLQGGEGTANLDVIKTLPNDQQVIAKGAFFRSLRTMWIMYVAVAALSLIAGCFIAVYPLSKEQPTVRIGLVENGNAATSEDQPTNNTEE